MRFFSKASNRLQKYYESVLKRNFENMDVVDSFMLFVLVKHFNVLELFDIANLECEEVSDESSDCL